MKKKPISASDLIKKLAANPEYQQMMKAKDDARNKLIEEERIQEIPIVDELNTVGYKFSRFHELENVPSPNPKVFEIIFKHMMKNYPGQTRGWLARLLGRKEAKFLWLKLVYQYQIEKDEKAKDGMAAALSDLADSVKIREIIELIKNKSNGDSRMYFTRNLSRSRNVLALPTLIELQDDPDLGLEIRRILKRKIK